MVPFSVAWMRDWKSLDWSKSSRLVEILSRGPECEERRQLLSSAGEKDSRGRTLFHWAAIARQTTLVSALERALPESAFDWQDNLGRTPLMTFLNRRGSSRSVRDIIPLFCWSNLQIQDANGKTGMHFVAEKMSGVLVAEAFCRSYDDVFGNAGLGIKDKEGNTPFHALARQRKPSHWGRWSRRPWARHETAATVLAEFFTLTFPESLQVVNRMGNTPLETLAIAGHVDALVAAVEVAPEEALFFKNERGLTFLSAAGKRCDGLLEAVVLAMPVDLIVRFEKNELLGHGEARRSPLLASLRSHDHAMAILEMLGDEFSKSYDWAFICTRAAEVGSFRVVLHLLKAVGAASCLGCVGHGYSTTNALLALCKREEWECSVETVAAEELLRTVPAEEFTRKVRLHTIMARAMCRGLPPFLAEIILSRIPEDHLTGSTVQWTSVSTRADKLEVLLKCLPAQAFDEPFLFIGLADKKPADVSPGLFERVLEMCSDEAFEPSLVTDYRGTLLHVACRSLHWEYLVPMLLARAPHLRDCTNVQGLTALECEQKRGEDSEPCRQLAALCGIGSFAKAAIS